MVSPNVAASPDEATPDGNTTLRRVDLAAVRQPRLESRRAATKVEPRHLVPAPS
jgi:hypothetical protein